jgi:hypothetical protein
MKFKSGMADTGGDVTKGGDWAIALGPVTILSPVTKWNTGGVAET